MKTLIAFLTFAALAAPAAAEPYVGAAVGASKQKHVLSECVQCDGMDVRDVAGIGKVYAGWRYYAWSAEVGAGQLGHFRNRARAAGYVDITQSVKTTYTYASVLRHFQLSDNVAPFVSVGIARVAFENREYGTNSPTLEYVEHENGGHAYRPIFGAGVSYKVTKDVALRAEVNRVSRVAVSPWTNSADVTAVWFGLTVRP